MRTRGELSKENREDAQKIIDEGSLIEHLLAQQGWKIVERMFQEFIQEGKTMNHFPDSLKLVQVGFSSSVRLEKFWKDVINKVEEGKEAQKRLTPPKKD